MPAPVPSPPATRAPRRTRAEQGEFYERVVQTSLQLFADGGYEAISMRRLAAEVGVPPMSLYRYFPTKAHLIRHIWDDVLARAYASATAALPPGPAPLRLRAYLDGFLQYWLDHRDHYWVVFALRDDMAERHADAEAYALYPNPQRFIRTLDELFDACVPPQRLSRGERQQTLDLIFCKALGFLLGTIGLASLGWVDVAALKQRLLDDILATLPADPAPRPRRGRGGPRLVASR